MVCTQTGKSPGTVTFSMSIEDGAGSSAAATVPGLFEVSFSGDVAALTNCVCLVGMTTVFLSDMEVALTGSSGFIGLVYDQDNDDLASSITAVFGGSGVSHDLSFDPDSPYCRVILFKVEKTEGAWRVVYRVGGIPHFMVYKS